MNCPLGRRIGVISAGREELWESCRHNRHCVSQCRTHAPIWQRRGIPFHDVDFSIVISGVLSHWSVFVAHSDAADTKPRYIFWHDSNWMLMTLLNSLLIHYHLDGRLSGGAANNWSHAIVQMENAAVVLCGKLRRLDKTVEWRLTRTVIVQWPSLSAGNRGSLCLLHCSVGRWTVLCVVGSIATIVGR